MYIVCVVNPVAHIAYDVSFYNLGERCICVLVGCFILFGVGNL